MLREMTSKEQAQKFHTDDVSLMYPDLGGVSDWLCHAANMLQLIRSTTRWTFSSPVPQTLFRGETRHSKM